MVMTRRKLLRAIDTESLKEAIQQAERKTSGEISVSVSPLFWGDVLGSCVIMAGGVVALICGVDAEGKGLEEIADPLTRVDVPAQAGPAPGMARRASM